jgi:hypothetical protein
MAELGQCLAGFHDLDTVGCIGWEASGSDGNDLHNY